MTTIDETGTVLVSAPIENGTEPAPGERDWMTAPIPDLVEWLVGTHHRFTREELDRGELLAEKVLRVHGARHAELAGIAGTFGELADDLRPHLEKEERILFPAIRTLVADPKRGMRLSGPIRVMEEEHAHVGGLLGRLHALTSGYVPPQDACASYRSLYECLEGLENDLHLHIHLEQNVLFPRVQALAPW
jgi:regulator of cell morphogenesis and NO signaling